MVHPLSKLAGILILGCTFGHAWAQDVVVVGLFSDRAVLKIDGQTILLKVGERSGEVSLLAVNAAEAKLKIGTKELVLGLGQDRGGMQADTNDKAVVEIHMNARGQFVTSGMINGRVVEFLVDTGANTVSMNRQDAKRLGVDYRRFGEVGYSQTANGAVKNWRVLLTKVKLGGISVSSVEASVRDVDDTIPVLLGMSFLSRVKMEHDQNRLRLTAK